MPGALLLAFEAGYNALPGVIPQDITSWVQMKEVYRELKKPEVKERFKAIIIDTIDLAADKCKKYICNQNGIEDLGELGYGRGWSKFKDEFNDVFRGLTQLGYAVFFIGHDKEQLLDKPDGTQERIIRPALSNSTREVIAGMADIFAYAHQKNPGEMSVLTLRCTDGHIQCGSRFKYLPEEITLGYDNLVNALHEAIDKEAAEHNNEYVTEERTVISTEEPTYDFEVLMGEFEEMVGSLMNKNQAYYAPRITEIVEKYLGKGKKASDATPKQAEFIYLIVEDMKNTLL